MKDKRLNVEHPIGQKDHWEVRLNPCPEGIPNDPAGAFLPMSGKKRPVPHVKVNEVDH